MFEEDKAWKGILDGSWIDFDDTSGPKRVPNRIQNRADIAPKNDQQVRSILDRSLKQLPRESVPAAIRAGTVEGVGGGINPSP